MDKVTMIPGAGRDVASWNQKLKGSKKHPYMRDGFVFKCCQGKHDHIEGLRYLKD